MTPLLELAQEYTNLTRRGKEWWGLCPLHEEKTPSFSVNEERGLFYCYGCGAGGDAISFLRKKRGLSFREAAEQVGKELTPHKQQERRFREAAVETIRARFRDWWRARIRMIADLRDEIEIAEIAYRSIVRAPEIWPEEEQKYWITILSDLYLKYDSILHENLIYATDEQAAWEAWRESKNA